MAYPRTISTTCVLAAIELLGQTPRPAWRELAAGCTLGLALALRYSQAIFVAPAAVIAALFLPDWPARTKAMLRLAGGFALGALAFVGAYETVTWGKPFGALLGFARYTLIEGRASSLVAHQPWYWYVWRLPHWWSVAGLPLLWRSFRGRLAWLWLFVAVPVGMLSFVHHKELRCLQGVIPFLCALAAAGAIDLWDAGRRRTAAALVVLCLVWGIAAVRFLQNKSMSAVLAAQAVASDPRIRTFAGTQLWAYGDRLFLGRERELRDIPFPTRPEDLERLARGVDGVGVYAGDLRERPELRTTLSGLGFCRWRDFSFRGSKTVTVLRPCRSGAFTPTARPAARRPERQRRAPSSGARRSHVPSSTVL